MRRSLGLLAAAACAAGSLSAAHAQWRFMEGNFPARFPPPSLPDRDFAFCKIMYDSVRYEYLGMGWATDYPYAGINLMIRFSELTTGRVSVDERGEPNHWVVRLADDALFNCPFTMASDVGTIGFSAEEVVRLREYLLKGGFLWVDDFWGSRAWVHWEREIARVLPPAQYPVRDVPLDHPVFRTRMHVPGVPQITAIQFWYGVGGRTTSERGPDSREPHFRAIADERGRLLVSERGPDSREPHFRAIADERGRLLVVMSHNTDIADAWEREADDPRYFERFSPDGYGLGINVLLYTMMH